MSKTKARPKSARAQKALRLRSDFPYYAKSFLKIRSKSGKIEPLQLNTAQQYIHDLVETQKRETGKVRALILKGRQQGCSTYVEARFYHRTSLGRGLRAFILSHEADSSANLFTMAMRFNENCPPAMRPATDRSNRQELVFSRTNCSYRVATAGKDNVGRSETIQLFHGSEVAYWPHASAHASGALQAVPDEEGTEIFLESTANGMANLYHQMWVKAEKGLSDYIAIFVPWFWQEEYQRAVPREFVLNQEEEVYMEDHQIPIECMVWRRAKIADIDEDEFRREYPATAAEAFQTSGKGILIPPENIMAARKGPKNIHPMGPTIGGCDPAGEGENGDRTAFAVRRGRVVLHTEYFQSMRPMEIVDHILKFMEAWQIDKMFVDKGGLGAGIVDRARELSNDVIGVMGGQKTSKPDRYKNKRGECWGEMAAWFNDPPVVIPDDDEVQADLMTVKAQYNSNSILVLDSYEKMREEFDRSPDLGVAISLTFAFPVQPKETGPLNPAQSAISRRGYVPQDHETRRSRRQFNPNSYSGRQR